MYVLISIFLDISNLLYNDKFIDGFIIILCGISIYYEKGYNYSKHDSFGSKTSILCRLKI